LFIYTFSHGSLIVKRKWKIHKDKYKIQDNEDDFKYDEAEASRDDVNEMPLSKLHLILHTEGPEAFVQQDGTRSFGSWIIALEYYLVSFIFLCTDKFVFLLYFYCVISVIGTLINPIWFSVFLLDVMVRFDTLQHVIQAVTTNIIQLLWTSMLILIILYIYTVIAFFVFVDMFYTYEVNKYDSSTIGESLCTDMLHCYMSVINLGLRNGGGIGDILKPDSYNNRVHYFSKLLFTFTFHIIVIVVMLNILFGIIIDTFAQLRDENREIDEDIRNK
jgi:hypothetical protein